MFPLKQTARAAICTQMAPRCAAGLWPAPRPESRHKTVGREQGGYEKQFSIMFMLPTRSDLSWLPPGHPAAPLGARLAGGDGSLRCQRVAVV